VSQRRTNQRTEADKSAAVRNGLIALLVIGVATYFGFTKAVPFRDHFEIKAAFKTANDLKPKSPVRIAGVKVGLVQKVEHIAGGRGAMVTMRIDDRSIPIRRDAQMKIRPRIFLEGNYFVDVKPGTPSSPALEEGDTLPVQQTATPVQFGQLLTALQSDTRRDLQIVLQELGRGLSGRGGRGYNASIQYWEDAYKNSAIVNQATLGILEHDLSGYIRSSGAVAEAFDRDPDALKALITDFSTTANALAVESTNLSAFIRELPITLRVGHRALGSLNAAFPPFRRFIAAMRPATRSSKPALDAALPFVIQMRRLVSRPELRGLVADLRPTVPSLVKLNRGGVPFQRQIRTLSSCMNSVVLPWTNEKVPDSKFPATGPIYQEAPKSLVGLAGESRSFDANGQYVRSLAATANFSFATGDGRRFFTTEPIQGINPPKALNGRPPLRSDVPCETQERPDLSTKVQAPPAQQQVDHSKFAASPLYDRARKDLLGMIEEQAKMLGTPIQVQGLGEALTLNGAPKGLAKVRGKARAR
jgi:phospholipid/cholesterol/gamma-HCH transport system substrate-binding protein